MFDLQLFDGTDTGVTATGYGFLSAEDNQIINSHYDDLRFITADNKYISFFTTTDTSTEPAFKFWAGGLPPAVSIIGGAASTTATSSYDTITSDNYFWLSGYGDWTVTNGGTNKTIEVSDCKLFTLIF